MNIFMKKGFIRTLNFRKNLVCGFTAIEIIIAIAVLGIILAVILPSLSTFRNDQTLKNTADDIATLLNQARTDTLSSKNSTYYSVHFQSDRAVYFVGGTYNSGASTNKTVMFDSTVTLPSGNISLNGAGANVTFDRLTGNTNEYGTITIQLAGDSTKQKVITVTKTGIVSAN